MFRVSNLINESKAETELRFLIRGLNWKAMTLATAQFCLRLKEKNGKKSVGVIVLSNILEY